MAKDIKKWDVEDQSFWQSEGKAVANRNLWVSVSALLTAFGVWFYWSIITIQMKTLGYTFSDVDYFSILAISGLSGATLRIPSAFLIRIAGGRNTIFFTTLLLLIPTIWTGIALTSLDTPLWVFQMCAFLGGIGGGNFASSMSNIGFFFPKKEKGLGLGLNAGIGNAGVTVTQILVPIIVTVSLGAAGLVLTKATNTFFGKIDAGQVLYAANTGWLWTAILVPVVLLTWFKMNNIVTEAVSPGIENKVLASFGRITIMLLVGFATSVLGLWMYLPAASSFHGLNLNFGVVMIVVIAVTVFLLTLIPGGIGEKVKNQYSILKKPNTWILTIMYTMTFGSFIGFSGAFGLSISIIFGNQHILTAAGTYDNILNPNGPNALVYTWMGAFVGSIVRPVGGKLGDKFGGNIVTLIAFIVMIVAVIYVANTMKVAYHSATPEQYFTEFLVAFLVLFAASGLGNGSVFKTAGTMFDAKEAGPLVGWMSAVAAYGAFIVPSIIGSSIKAGTPENSLYGLAVFYICVTVLILVTFLRPGSPHRKS